MTIRERINEAIHISNAKEFDTAHKLYNEIRQDAPNNKRALYCQAVNLYNMSYHSEHGDSDALKKCIWCCKLYVKDEPPNRHMKVKNLALMAYQALLFLESEIWIEA